MMLAMFLKSIPVSPLTCQHPLFLLSTLLTLSPVLCLCACSPCLPPPRCWWWPLRSLAERWCSGSSALYRLSLWGVQLWLHRSARLPFSVLINVGNYSQGTGSEWQRHQFTLSQTMGMRSGFAQNFILHLLPSRLYVLRLLFWVEKSIWWLLYLIFPGCIVFLLQRTISMKHRFCWRGTPEGL